MQPVDRVARETIEQPIRQHGERAASAFLGGLEDQVQGAAEIGVLGEVPSGTEQHCGVAVVAAGMHLAGNGRGVGRAGLFVDRQGIHVGAQPDGALARTPPDDGTHHARSADPLCDRDAPFAQLVRDQGGGAGFLQAEFGVGVDVAPDGGELGVMDV